MTTNTTAALTGLLTLTVVASVGVDAQGPPQPAAQPGRVVRLNPVDSAGNLFATGPGGVLIISPAGTLLGRIELPESPANCAWGEDGKTLFITARTSVYRVRVLAGGRP